jgi:hypothetical protein
LRERNTFTSSADARLYANVHTDKSASPRDANDSGDNCANRNAAPVTQLDANSRAPNCHP